MSGWQERRVSGGRVAALLDKLAEVGIAARSGKGPAGPAALLEVDAAAWGRVAGIAAAENLRWCAVWGEHRPPEILVTAVLFGRDGHLLLRTAVPEEKPELTSQAPFYPAADRPERHVQDMFGVRFTDHPDGRRWTRHLAWQQGAASPAPRFPQGRLAGGRDRAGLRISLPAGGGRGGLRDPGGAGTCRDHRAGPLPFPGRGRDHPQPGGTPGLCPPWGGKTGRGPRLGRACPAWPAVFPATPPWPTPGPPARPPNGRC